MYRLRLSLLFGWCCCYLLSAVVNLRVTLVESVSLRSLITNVTTSSMLAPFEIQTMLHSYRTPLLGYIMYTSTVCEVIYFG
jgi:hypothetical protein